MKVIIIDDEPLARLVIKEYLMDHPEIDLVAECNDGFEGAKAIVQFKPDLVFLDVQMPKINGFEMLEILNEKPKVIFTTAFDEYALKAFEANAIDYLLKPFPKERFEQALSKSKLISKAENTEVLSETVHKQPDEHLRIVIKDEIGRAHV